MGKRKAQPPVGGAAYFELLADKLRAASREICRSCDTDVPVEARPHPDLCRPVDCSAKRILRAADSLGRDSENEDGSAA